MLIISSPDDNLSDKRPTKPPGGFEPPTCCLQDSRSYRAELRRRVERVERLPARRWLLVRFTSTFWATSAAVRAPPADRRESRWISSPEASKTSHAVFRPWNSGLLLS